MSQELPPKTSVEFQPTMSPELLTRALHAVADGLFLFDSEKHLIFANQQAHILQSNISRLRIGSRCCEMFWRTGEDEGCVVDRALDNGLKLEFEIPGNQLAKPLFIKVQPIGMDGDETKRGALVIAHDISALRRAEAQAIAHKSFMANLADRSPDEIYALDKIGR